MKPIKHVVKTTPLAFYTFFVKVYLLSFFFFVKIKQSLGVQRWRFVYHTKRRKIICDWPLFFNLSFQRLAFKYYQAMFQWLKYCLSTFLLLFLLPPGSNITIYRIDWEFYTSIEEKNYKAFNWQKLKSIQLIKVDIVTAGTKVGKFVNVISAPRACNAPCSACPALIFQIPVIFKIFQTPVIFLVWWAEKQYQRPKTKVPCFNLSNTNDFFRFLEPKNKTKGCAALTFQILVIFLFFNISRKTGPKVIQTTALIFQLSVIF